MSRDGFLQKGIELIRLRGHPRFYKFVTKYVGTAEPKDEQIHKLEQIGAKAGLDPIEVRAALAGSSKNNPGSFPRWLAYLLIIIVVVIAVIVGSWTIYWWHYPPGTLYDALAPHDFE